MGCNFMGNYMTREVLSKPVTTQKIGISLKATLKFLPVAIGVCLITFFFLKTYSNFFYIRYLFAPLLSHFFFTVNQGILEWDLFLQSGCFVPVAHS